MLLIAFLFWNTTQRDRAEDAFRAQNGASHIGIGAERVAVVFADTPEERERGLSGRDTLREGEGMLFVFPEDGRYAFWMKDMRFSIDILWLSSDGEIVHIIERMSPDSYPEHAVSPRPARYVVELPAGYVEAHGIILGDIVRL